MLFVLSGMFTYHEKSRLYWFNNECKDQDEEFNLVGVVSSTYIGMIDRLDPSSVCTLLANPHEVQKIIRTKSDFMLI